MSKFALEERGSLYTESYRIFLKDSESGVYLSPFHDVPLRVEGSETGELHMVVEVSRWSNAKLEISRAEKLNPIRQDLKDEKVRFVANLFPHKGYIWNYGAFPQTWENPEHTDEETGTKGDNDPLDVCDISGVPCSPGQVITVRPLGVLAMIDEGETDWKVIAINTADPDADKFQDIKDVEKFRPGLLHATIEWFKYYKVPDGKPVNQFAFDAEFKDRAFAQKVIDETHGFWQGLLQSDSGDGEGSDRGIALVNTSYEGSTHRVGEEEAGQLVSATAEKGEPGELPPSVYSSYFINAAT